MPPRPVRAPRPRSRLHAEALSFRPAWTVQRPRCGVPAQRVPAEWRAPACGDTTARGDGVGNLWNWFWFIVFLWSLAPLYRQRLLHQRRLQLIRAIERRRGSRLISLIHRQESVSFLGIPISRYITIEDSEEVLRAIHLTPPDVPIDMVLHTPGGLVLAAEQIAQALRRHRAPVTVFVPHYAMSGGTLIALAADRVVMDPNAVLGPVDPQLGSYPAVSLLRAVREKGRDKVDDQTLILADIAEKAVAQVQEFVVGLLETKMPKEEAEKVATVLTHGKWTHDYPIDCDKLRALGLDVDCEMPEAVYHLMDLYPQPGGRRPSVQYIPVPYTRER
ncbi:MAG: ATP-dependent Clp protease proteolytic subunit [Firmicutes bacterium]|nr:ATP-dependent Clp protease proteolytic subunit [Bacillota bacterium]MBE3590463.1 ATP-dependent Clp protease proteolytic subunit [Bacillota bacterium]